MAKKLKEHEPENDEPLESQTPKGLKILIAVVVIITIIVLVIVFGGAGIN